MASIQLCLADSLPGTSSFPNNLVKTLESRLTTMGPDYKPRTSHLNARGKPVYTNRLILEDSPYLIQHAHNPVNWHAWGEEPFAIARQQNKPVFLSIGYSTCHWCHVMERESFDNITIAKFMNEHFIAIKVDRERRPEVDNAYLTAVNIIAGRGGWPMSVFLTPRGQPFHGGTYYPPDAFLDLLHQIENKWADDQNAIQRQSDELQALVENRLQTQEQTQSLDIKTVIKAINDYLMAYDPINGGFGETPKFPNEPLLLFLLQHLDRAIDPELLAALEHTLQMMSRGGINDQIGGGFHRYSTDEQWLIPHFEKMLYNQAHIARAYLLLYHITGKTEYARTAQQILDYVARDMTSPEGSFYSATDADSEGKEGRFYVWTENEIEAALSAEDARLAIDVFGVTAPGNFEGRNILYLPVSLKHYADSQNMEYDALLKRIDTIRAKLYQTRKQRVAPLKDKKILTAWNGMMITSYALAARMLDKPGYLEKAISAARFIIETQWRDNKLQRVYLEGRSSLPAKQDDYAYLIQALITLYDMTRDKRWLNYAEDLAAGMINEFHDETQGGFLMSQHDPSLYIQPRDIEEGAIPSGNGIALTIMAMLFDRTGKQRYQDLMLETLKAINNAINHPTASPTLLAVVDQIRSQTSGNPVYGARGNVVAAADIIRKNGATQLHINLEIADGWHINSDQSQAEDIIPTSIDLAENKNGWQLEPTSFPPPLKKQFSFISEPLTVFEGKLELLIPLRKTGDPVLQNYRLLPINIHYQACNDTICLAPETLQVITTY